MTKEEMQEFVSMSDEEKRAQLYEDCQKAITQHLEIVFRTRAMQLSVTPEKKDELDEYINGKGRELSDKYEGMSNEELLLATILDKLAAIAKR